MTNMEQSTLGPLLTAYRANPDLVYHTWFTGSTDRLKAFRSVRRGVLQVIDDIKQGSFPNDFKGSSLEFVLHCITEQKEVFEGAAHPFYWKPKLRIPDIYENQQNQRAFGQFLESCVNASSEDAVIAEIIRLDECNIKGLGPSVASILYFLHPTVIPPCNTAIVNGFNTLFGERIKLGSWKEYLRMREVIVQTNDDFKQYCSNDLGAFTGFLFEIGMNNILVGQEESLSDKEMEKALKRLARRHKKVIDEKQEDESHTEMQYQLLRIGHALGYDVVPASNDRSKSFGGTKFSFLSLPDFPQLDVPSDVYRTICLIDVVWFEKGTEKIVCAFEVEKSTSIFSGILRLTDLSVSLPSHDSKLYIVIPDKREKEVKIQLQRPSIREHELEIHYILSSDLLGFCDAMCKFGDDHSILKKIAKKC